MQKKGECPPSPQEDSCQSGSGSQDPRHWHGIADTLLFSNCVRGLCVDRALRKSYKRVMATSKYKKEEKVSNQGGVAPLYSKVH